MKTDKIKISNALQKSNSEFEFEVSKFEISVYLPHGNPFPCKLTFFFNENEELILINEKT